MILRHCLAFAVVLLGSNGADASTFRLMKCNETGPVLETEPVTCEEGGPFVRWARARIEWHTKPRNTDAREQKSIEAALATWDAESRDYSIVSSGRTKVGFVAADGLNTISWGAGPFCGAGCIGITMLTLEKGQVITEADIMLQSKLGPDASWDTTGADVDLEGVVAHELGHSLGIHESESIDAIPPTMRESYVGREARTLEKDDRDALRCLERWHPVK